MNIPPESVQTTQAAFPKASSCTFFLGLPSSSNSEEFHQSSGHILAGDVVQLKQGAVTCRLCHVLSMAVFLRVLLFQADFLHSLFQGAAFPVPPITFMAWIVSIPMRKAQGI